MKTTDIEALTNSVIQAMDKEFRKNDIATFTPDHPAYRAQVKVIVMEVVQKHTQAEHATTINEIKQKWEEQA